jgi:hypothetical protein
MNRFYAILVCLMVSAPVAFAQVTFLVQQVPANTPAADTLYVAGSFQG